MVSPTVASPPTNRAVVELIETIVRDATFMADLTARFLEQFGNLPSLKERRKTPVALPREFLTELGAVLRIAVWERAGIRDRLDQGLPRAEKALAELFARYTRGPLDGQSEQVGSKLALEVFKVSIRRLAWGGREELHADVVLDGPDDDALLEAMADLLWEHRHVGRAEE